MMECSFVDKDKTGNMNQNKDFVLNMNSAAFFSNYF